MRGTGRRRVQTRSLRLVGSPPNSPNLARTAAGALEHSLSAMSEVRHQALVDAPLLKVWELLADPGRYPEWFPRTIEIRGTRFEEGVEFLQVFAQPLVGRTEARFLIDTINELREIRMHCTTTGTFVHWQLTDAQGGTFLDAGFGMNPVRRSDRLFDPFVGRPFFRRWLAEAIDSLSRAAGDRTSAA
jgi:Polyketide cyclase / dehydrase and lipid transport